MRYFWVEFSITISTLICFIYMFFCDHITLYTYQEQSQTSYQQVVSNAVTCNPIDGTLRWHSVASNCYDYHHGAYYSTNPTNTHLNRFAFPQHDANQAIQMQHRVQNHPMLPPIALEQDSEHLYQQHALMEYHNHQMYLPHTQVNASFNQQTYQSRKITNERHLMQMKQPPVKLFIKNSYWKCLWRCFQTISRFHPSFFIEQYCIHHWRQKQCSITLCKSIQIIDI